MIFPSVCSFLIQVYCSSFLVITCRLCRTPGKQLRLFDIRLRQTELHAFGWKQESSDSLSALINQTWSPDGLYITSGSVDPVIHIFDIRSYAHKPSQSIKAHQKRVFKAIWHHSLPLLISISSDLNIGLHKLSWNQQSKYSWQQGEVCFRFFCYSFCLGGEVLHFVSKRNYKLPENSLLSLS